MDVNEFLNVGSGILNDVSRAVETGNFNGLGERTKERVNFAVSQFQKPYENAVRDGSAPDGTVRYRAPGTAPSGNRVQTAGAPGYQPYAYDQKRSYFLNTRKKPPSGVVRIVLGSIGMGFAGVGAIVNQVIAAVLASSSVVAAPIFGGLSALCGVLFLICTGVMVSGIQFRKLIKKYYEYGSAVGNAEYFSIEKLADRLGTSTKELIKNLEKMIRNNLLPGARMDRNKTTLMLTNRAYEQYKAAENSRIQREANAQLRGEPAVKVTDDMNGDVKRILEDGNRALIQVRAINDEIPDTMIMSEKLYRLEEIMRRIFDQVKKDPSSAQDLRKFMDYYLPTTTKLLTAYVELDKQPVQGDNIKNTKAEIENSLDTINDAFEQLLDSMFTDMALDISTDISVMKTMMAQDGLAQDEIPLGKA
ncbi:MAG: 5-bromo-4-chloroindolyl phosphate hydrolysis family protein [Lachnospiraceae bacterium]|nr:5-bromo-4-chloroindolyl phosphate hydrolysis family protein [Lachnospiraceae bacterium]